MVDTTIVLLIGLPLIIPRSVIGSDSTINFGLRISKARPKNEEELKRLRGIKTALMLVGSFILVGGFACLAFHWEDYQLVVMLVPEMIVIVYMLLQLYKTEKEGKGILTLMLSIIVILDALLPIGTFLITATGNDMTTRSNTLFIEGPYAKEILIASITQVDDNAMVPDMKVRTNGTLVGENNVGHFQTKEGKDVLSYLHSDDMDVTHIEIENGGGIYINPKDSALSVDFPNQLKIASH